MEFSIQEILSKRIEAHQNDTLEQQFIKDGKEYQKNWAKGVQFFQIAINKDRKKEGLKDLPFMAIRQKLVAIREIDDMRWFYRQCLAYSRKKGKNFSMCFFGALKIK